MSDQLADSDAEKAMEEMPKAFNKLCIAEVNQLSLDAADISNANLEALPPRSKQACKIALKAGSKIQHIWFRLFVMAIKSHQSLSLRGFFLSLPPKFRVKSNNNA